MFIPSFVSGHLLLFLANVNNPSINIGVKIIDVLKGQFLIYRSLLTQHIKKDCDLRSERISFAVHYRDIPSAYFLNDLTAHLVKEIPVVV